MAASRNTSVAPLMFVEGWGRVEPAKRKLIRKYVMVGKNRGKTHNVKATRTADQYGGENSSVDPDEASGLLVKMRYSVIPSKVGSELSFTRFAATVEPQLLHDILKFSFIAKRVMYPLESCIVFHRKTDVDRSWFEFLTSDAAYLHASVFAIQGYKYHVSGRQTPLEANLAIAHHSAALRLLQDRLSTLVRSRKISDSTVLVVLYLALHAHVTNDLNIATQHMNGLRKIVELKGGLAAFSYNSKLIIELLKCDLGIAVNNGTEPTFVDDPYLDSVISYGLSPQVIEGRQLSEAKSLWDPNQLDMDAELVHVWTCLQRFCTLINDAVRDQRQLSKETLLKGMAPVMYRLVGLKRFASTSVDEVVRLGLLAFSSHIFLNWQNVKLPHTYLPNSYRENLLEHTVVDAITPQLLLWLLVVGSLSTFSPSDDAWLVPELCNTIKSCGVQKWAELHKQLKAFPWIDFLHDRPGRATYEKCLVGHTTTDSKL